MILALLLQYEGIRTLVHEQDGMLHDYVYVLYRFSYSLV